MLKHAPHLGLRRFRPGTGLVFHGNSDVTPQQKQEPPCLSLKRWRALQRAGELQFAASQALDHRYCDLSTVSPACTGLLSMYAAIRSNSRTSLTQ